LYFDDGLGAPGRCPHERVWGGINDHSEERGRNLTDVEMDDFMVDLGELISKEYDAWIERCW
jgi:RNA polymerase II-associated protein 3